MVAQEDSLQDWVQMVPVMISHLKDFQLPRGEKLDFGVASLRRLEEIALERFGRADDLADGGVRLRRRDGRVRRRNLDACGRGDLDLGFRRGSSGGAAGRRAWARAGGPS